MTAHLPQALAAPYALGALDPSEEADFRAHLQSGCPACAAEVESYRTVLRTPDGPPSPRLRPQVLELAEAPRLPIDPAAYDWLEPVPGIRMHVVKEQPERSFRAALVWADPGARHPRHRHHGEEVILVLKGGIRDFRGEYTAGSICRSATDSTHAEEVLPLGECFCYALYYGPLEMLGD